MGDLVKNIWNRSLYSYLAAKYVPIENGIIKLADGTWGGDLALSFFSHPDVGLMYDSSFNSILFINDGQIQMMVGNGFIAIITQFLSNPGNLSIPTYSFLTDPDTGIYLESEGVLCVSSNGVKALSVTSLAVIPTKPIYGVAGTASAPGFTFVDDTNTGIYSDSVNTIKFATDGTLRITIDTSGVSSTIPIGVNAGSASTPSYTFSTDTNTGLYLINPDVLGVTAGGTVRFSVASTYVATSIPIQLSNGSQSAPALTFSSDINTGFFRVNADIIGVACGGVLNTTFGISETNFETDVIIDGSLTVDPTGNQNFQVIGGSTTEVYYNMPTTEQYANDTIVGYLGTTLLVYDGVSTHSFATTTNIKCLGQYAIRTSDTTGYFMKSSTSLWSMYRDSATANLSLLQLKSNYGGTDTINWAVFINGDTKSTTGVYTVLSDKRAKKNIRSIEDGHLDKISKLKVKKYKLKQDSENDKERIGLLVQDIIDDNVLPELVSESKCELKCDCEKVCSCGPCEDVIYIDDESGERYHPKAIQASNLPFILIKAVQELTVEVRELRAELQQLKTQVNGVPTLRTQKRRKVEEEYK